MKSCIALRLAPESISKEANVWRHSCKVIGRSRSEDSQSPPEPRRRGNCLLKGLDALASPVKITFLL